MPQTAPSCALFAVDIVGAAQYPGSLHIALRKALNEIVWSSLERVGVSRHEDVLRVEDEGDGLAVVLRDGTTARLVDAIPEINKEMRRRSREFDPPLKMCVAVHHGLHHPTGSGTARIELARMLKSGALKQELVGTDAHVAVMISDDVHRTVVRDGYTETVTAADFRPMDIRAKKAELRVWVHTPAPPSALARVTRYLKRKDASVKTRPRAPSPRSRVLPPGEMPPTRAIIAVDLQGYSEYPDAMRPAIRQAMRNSLGSALAQVGIAWDPDEQSDRVRTRDDGDGFVVILGDGEMARLVDVVPRLSRELRRYDRDFDRPLKMRVAVHHGPIDSSGSGITRIEVAQMLGSDQLRDVLDESGSNVAVMVSDHVYHAAIFGKFAESVEPTDFHPRVVRVGQGEIRTWVHAPPPPPPPLRERLTGAFGATAAAMANRKRKTPEKLPSSATPTSANRGFRANRDKSKEPLRIPPKAETSKTRRRAPSRATADAFSAVSVNFRGTRNQQSSQREKKRAKE